MLNNIIYLFATTSLLIGSILTFNNKIPDYFYLIGTILFTINSFFRLIETIENKKLQNNYNNILNNYDSEYTERYI